MAGGNPFKKGEGGAPLGNRNARRAGVWRKAIDKALADYVDTAREIHRGSALYHIAKQCVEDSLSANPDVRAQARNEIANRLDGKPKEHVEVDMTTRFAQELTDGELLDIARGGSAGAADEASGEEVDSSVH